MKTKPLARKGRDLVDEDEVKKELGEGEEIVSTKEKEGVLDTVLVARKKDPFKQDEAPKKQKNNNNGNKNNNKKKFKKN